MSPRLRRVLKLVDELELDAQERRALRAELDARDACEVDLDACTDDHERQLARTLKERLDAAARGETRSLSMPEFWKAVEHERGRRRATSR